MPRLSLSRRQVDLWCVSVDRIAEPSLWDAYRDLLSPDEREREQRFTCDEAHRNFLAARALLRTVLSRYTGIEPRRLEFRCNHFGKPSLRGHGDIPIEFSLSHTRGLVVCAVTLQDLVGVDAEGARRRSSPMELARRYFSPAEAARVAERPTDERHAVFLDYWTLKEAFTKALGVGLSIPLADFSFTLLGEDSATISFAKPGDERPDQWQFHRLRLAPCYQVAVALRRPAAERSEIVIRQTIPLADS